MILGSKRYVSQRHAIENLAHELQVRSIDYEVRYPNIITKKIENLKVKQESTRLIQKEQEKREKLSFKFENTIADIKLKMENDLQIKKSMAQESKKLKESFIDALKKGNLDKQTHQKENIGLKEKLTNFIEQYELRETHFLQVIKKIGLESHGSIIKTGTMDQSDIFDYQHRVQAQNCIIEGHKRQEIELKKQLSLYVEKFNQVECTLKKSNGLFTSFRKEMGKMTEKTQILENENTELRVLLLN